MDEEISAAELHDLLESGSVRVVDIRSPASFARGRVPGSENVPFGRLPNEVESLAGADRIVTVCPHGKASVQAARLIKSYEGTADATIESMRGGLEAWDGPIDRADADGRVESGADEGPEAPF